VRDLLRGYRGPFEKVPLPRCPAYFP
jgi:hypothetical protein